MLSYPAAASSSQPLKKEPAGTRTTPLHTAVRTTDRASLERALAAPDSTDPDSRDSSGQTPLLLAAASGAPELTQLLLQHGADPSVAGAGGRTPLHAAAERGCLQTVRLLLRHGGLHVSAQDDAGLSPLGVARSAACVRALAEADGALSAADLRLLLRDRPAVLRQLLDLGVQPGKDGVLRVTYRPLRDVGRDCPFEAELMSGLYRSGCWQMFGHPAVELLLEVTRQDTLWLAVTNLALTVVFLAILCTKVMFDLYQVEDGSITILKWVLVAFNIARVFTLLVRWFALRFTVFLTLRFWPEPITTVLTFLVLFLPPGDWIKPIRAITLLSGFLELTLVVESIPKWKTTKAISSLVHVTCNIVGYLLLYVPILIGFGFAFFLLLKKDIDDRNMSRGDVEERKVFRGDVLTMTVAAMVIGNVDITQINEDAPTNWGQFGVVSALTILFMVLAPVVILNMLLALTISDTTKFLSKGSSEYLHHVAVMTSTSQRTLFSLDRSLGALQNRLPGWMFSCVSSLMLCVKWRSALPRQFDVEGSSCVTLTVDPVADDGKTVRVNVWSSKRHYRVSKSVRHGLDQIVRERMDAETSSFTESSRRHMEKVGNLSIQLQQMTMALIAFHSISVTSQRQLPNISFLIDTHRRLDLLAFSSVEQL